MPLDRCFARVDWGDAHLKSLQGDINAAIEARKANGEKLWEVAKHFDQQNSRFAFTVGAIMDLPAEQWGLRASDGIHHIRSALDNLAWTLVEGSPTGLPVGSSDRQAIYFPIYLSKADFVRDFDRRLPGVPDYQRAIIERAQPYRRSNDPKRHPLRILHDLSIDDKHKALPIVLFRNTQLTLRVPNTESRDCICERIETANNDGRLYLGAEVGWGYVRITGPEPNVHVYCEAIAHPAFENGIRLYEVETFTINMVRDLVKEFAAIL